MGQPRFNIDHISDDQFFAVTEGLAISGQFMDEKGSSTLLIVSLSPEGAADGVLAGTITEAAIEALEKLVDQLKERALELDGDDAVVLHLEEPAD